MNSPSPGEAIEAFITNGIDTDDDTEDGAPERRFPSEEVWRGLAATGTEIWLDTGDIDGASDLWRGEMTALTTNNTLLYNEIKKGIYDEVTREAVEFLGEIDAVDPATAVIEIAFILNARHGLRLVERFGARVSVELHTDLAHDVEGTVAYAHRFHRIAPEKFIVKVPFTPSGLIATRRLRNDGVPVNMTLGFSARQNHIAAVFCSPDYLNVFLGRLNAYVADHGLGSGILVGEKATLASQRTLAEINNRPGRPSSVRQIAASMRSADQVATIAGVDVHTMPLKVARGVLESPPASWRSRVDEDPMAGIDDTEDSRSARLGVLWDIDTRTVELARDLDETPPGNPEDLVNRVHDSGLGDLFPKYSGDDLSSIAGGGKIPEHGVWRDRMASGELAVDALLSAAGLASFAADQRALDARIRGFI